MAGPEPRHFVYALPSLSVYSAPGSPQPGNGWRGAVSLTKLHLMRPRIGVSMRSAVIANGRFQMSSDNREIRNPFGVMDVPAPADQDVHTFAATAKLDGNSSDENATSWAGLSERNELKTIDGRWESRWNGGADPTIPGDAAGKWKQGRSEVRTEGEHVYLLFEWDGGSRRGLIEARREGSEKLMGKYINLTDPTITRPWIGLIVGHRRIDGRWTGGRLDFRR